MSAILAQTGRRRYRNRRIGEFLKEMHLTEGRNTGFRKIRNALRNNGSPEPLFETDEERTYFATTLFFHPDFVKTGIDDSQNDNENDIENDNVIKVLNKNERVIFEVIRRNPDLSADQIAGLAEVSKSTVSRTIKKLKDKGLIRRCGSDRKGTWEILK